MESDKIGLPMNALSGFERIFSSVFAIGVGVGMIGQWIAFYMKRRIPELDTEPLRIKLHLGAEFMTAAALILGGAALLADKTWGEKTLLIALGMLLYTLVVSSGYFAQKRQWSFIGMFAGLFVLTLFCLYLIF